MARPSISTTVHCDETRGSLFSCRRQRWQVIISPWKKRDVRGCFTFVRFMVFLPRSLSNNWQSVITVGYQADVNLCKIDG
jgi:hypothetical protein